jgi:hypothetical protein
MDETVSASTSVAYNPSNSLELGGGASAGSFSCVVQDVFTSAGGAVHTKFKGCLANGKIVGEELGAPLTLQVEITGIFEEIADETALVLTGQDTTVPNPWKAGTFTAFGDAVCPSSFELDFGNQIELEMDCSDSSGYLAAYFADQTPILSMNPKADLIANVPHYTRWAAGTEGAIAISTSNWVINADKCQIITQGDGSQESIVAYDQTLRLNRDSANGYPFILTHT